MKRRRLVGLLVAFLVVVSAVSLAGGRGHHQVLGAASEVVPTTAPLVIKATADDQGATISWQASQDGTFPVHTYQIFRKNADGQFGQVGEVATGITQYLDSAGKEGDVYKLTSSDDQQPADVSLYSDEITAAAPQPVSAPTAPSTAPVATSPPTSPPTPAPSLPAPQVSTDYLPPDLPANINPQAVVVSNLNDLTKSVGSLPTDSTTPLDDKKVEQVQKNTNLQAAQLETVIVTAKEPLIQPILSQYTHQTQQLYQHFNQLTDTQKAATKQSCQQQTTALETSLLNLPEQYQMDLFVALAHCHLINGEP